MKFLILVLMSLSFSALAAKPECLVKTYSPNGKVIQNLKLQTYANESEALVGESTAEVYASYQENSFTICIYSEISESATVVCSKGENPNLIYNGKVITCSVK